MSREAVTFLMEGFRAQQKPCFVGTAGDINPIGQYYPLSLHNYTSVPHPWLPLTYCHLP